MQQESNSKKQFSYFNQKSRFDWNKPKRTKSRENKKTDKIIGGYCLSPINGIVKSASVLPLMKYNDRIVVFLVNDIYRHGYTLPGGKGDSKIDIFPNGEYSHIKTAIREMKEEAKIDANETKFRNIFSCNSLFMPIYFMEVTTPIYIARLPDDTDFEIIKNNIIKDFDNEDLSTEEREIKDAGLFYYDDLTPVFEKDIGVDIIEYPINAWNKAREYKVHEYFFENE